MKKLKSNITHRIKNIDLQIAKLKDDFLILDNALQHLYGITDAHFDYDYDNWTDNDYEYDNELAKLYHDYDYGANKLNAKKAAAMLIGYNIARRGKLLHESAVLKKVEKLGPDGEFIRHQMTHICNPMIFSFPHLHMELGKYGVTLLDYNYFITLINRMKLLEQSDMPQHIKEQRLNRYETRLKLFNAQIQNKYEQKQRTK